MWSSKVQEELLKTAAMHLSSYGDYIIGYTVSGQYALPPMEHLWLFSRRQASTAV